MTNPFPLKMAGFELPTSGRFSLPGDTPCRGGFDIQYLSIQRSFHHGAQRSVC